MNWSRVPRRSGRTRNSGYLAEDRAAGRRAGLRGQAGHHRRTWCRRWTTATASIKHTTAPLNYEWARQNGGAH